MVSGQSEGNRILDEVVSSVQEMQVKIGSTDGSVSLFLPLDSIEGDPEEAIRAFRDAARDILGDVECSSDGRRVSIMVPEKGCEYVSSLPVSPILRIMVDSVMARSSLDDIRARLEAVSDGLVWKEVDGEGFDHIAFFTDGTDPYVYCIDSDCGPISYHRFTRRDYRAFGFGGLE